MGTDKLLRETVRFIERSGEVLQVSDSFLCRQVFPLAFLMVLGLPPEAKRRLTMAAAARTGQTSGFPDRD